MATFGLLLLLASWALLGTPQLQTDARPAPYGVKLCGREFIRAVIFTCGGSRWRRADILAHDTLGDFFPDTEANTDNLASELDEAVGSSEWLALTKSPHAFYGKALKPPWSPHRLCQDAMCQPISHLAPGYTPTQTNGNLIFIAEFFPFPTPAPESPCGSQVPTYPNWPH